MNHLTLISETIARVCKSITTALENEKPEEALSESLKLTGALANLLFYYEERTDPNRHYLLGKAMEEVSKLMEEEWKNVSNFMAEPPYSTTIH